jgi:hypothetical protein
MLLTDRRNQESGLNMDSAKFISRAVVLTKATLFEFAYTFGMISPKKTMAKVVMKVKETTIIPVREVVPNILQVTKVARVTMATLMKLLNINMVANSFCGFLMS